MPVAFFLRLSYFVAAAMILGLAILTWPKRRVRGGWYLFGLSLAGAYWSVFEGLIQLGFSAPTRMILTQGQYLGIQAAAPLTLLFVLTLFGLQSWVTPARTFLLFVIPVLTVSLAWTNDFHHLIWTRHYMIETGYLTTMGLEYGLMFWLMVSYFYLIFAAITFVLVHQLITAASLYRAQAGSVLLAMIVVWLANGVYVSGHSPVPGMDPTPLGFSLVAGVMAYGFFKYGLLDILPVARAQVYTSLEDGILVVDAPGRVIDLNPAAEGILGLSRGSAIGQEVESISGDPSWAKALAAKGPGEISLRRGEEERTYDHRVTPLADRKGNSLGRLIVLRDITEAKRVEAALRESELRYRTLFEKANDAIFLTDLNDRIIDANRQACQLLGYSHQEMLALKVPDLQAPEVRGEEGSVIRSELARPTNLPLESVDVRRDGTRISVEVGSALISSAGEGLVLSIVRDITARKLVEEALRESEEKFRLVVESANEGILVLQQERCKFVNDYGLRLFGTSRVKMLSRPILEFIHPDDQDLILKRIQKRLAGESVEEVIEHRIIDAKGGMKWVETRDVPTIWDGLPALIAFVTDISTRKQMEENLIALATTDSLTGADNRYRFLEKAEMELRRCRRYQGQMAVLMLDLDHFKRINDTFGHHVGDRVLQAAVRVCQTILRATDIFGRVGGEEFAAILVETVSEEAAAVAERLRAGLADLTVDSEQGPVRFTVSIGLTTLEKEDASFEAVLQRADSALYKAKEAGRNRVARLPDPGEPPSSGSGTPALI